VVVEMAVVLDVEQQGRWGPQVPQVPRGPQDLPVASVQQDSQGLRALLAGLDLLGQPVHRALQVSRARQA
jgi:hypothetical protein